MGESIAKALGSSLRNKQRLVGSVERYLLSLSGPGDRRTDCIHPSELAHANWCPRAVYYRIMGVEQTDPGELKKISTEIVFETGHQAHSKWQSWFWEMGILRGKWYCLVCRKLWWDTSPQVCPNNHSRRFIQYREVPMYNKEYLIGGQADGDVHIDGIWSPIEIKTVGIGTVRHEAPKTVERFTHSYVNDLDEKLTYTDWPGLWANIRRPFASHLKQGMLYLFCLQRETITYLYEPKFVTAAPKEFRIEFQLELIEDLLEQCLIVKRAVEKERPPKRPLWADYETPRCEKCVYRSHCYATSQSRRDGADRSEAGRDQSDSREGRARPARKARVHFAETPYESDGPVRRQTHAVDGKVRQVSGLRGRPAKSRGNR